MNSPIEIICSKHGIDKNIKNIIKSFIRNEVAYKALKEYFSYLYYKKELYQDFSYTQYVKPNCRCFRYWNSRVNRHLLKECNECYKFEYTYIYTPNDFIECIEDNSQFRKIYYD